MDQVDREQSYLAQWYREYGFVLPRREVVTRADEAGYASALIGYPVVMKIVSPDILHKTDAGGVVTGVRSEEQARQVFDQIVTSVKGRQPQAKIEGVSIEEMVEQGVEIIIGLNNDPQFGPTLMFGLGGVLTEIFRDVSFRVLPITRQDAAQMLDEIRGARILNGYRGQPPVSREMLIDLLMAAGNMGVDLGPELDSVDFNPIVVWGAEHRVLDVKIIRRSEPQPLSTAEPNVENLEGFFSARAVAVVGASATPGKVGNTVLDSLLTPDFKGRVFPINPTRAEIMGQRAYPSLTAIPEPVDLVVVTVGLAAVPDLLRECQARGIHNMVIISGGGKELGGENEALEMEIQRTARECDVRIVGCNCIGVTNAATRMDTFFQSRPRMLRPPLGPVSMMTQSGTMGIGFIEDIYAAGISKLVSYGNRIDVDEADLLAYFERDASTKVIASYVEGLKDGRKFLETARRVAKSKPIVIFKTGRTQAAARAAVSHTGFFGGLYNVYAGAFKQAGLIAVDSYEELVAATKALAMQPRAQGSGIAMISNGAGSMVQGIDLMAEYGLVMNPLSDSSVRRLQAVYPPFYVIQNPIDVTGSASAEDYRVGIEVMMDDPNVDIIMPWFVFQNAPLGEEIVEFLGELSGLQRKPILCGAFGGPFTHSMGQRIEARRIPVYYTVREWIVAASALVER